MSKPREPFATIHVDVIRDTRLDAPALVLVCHEATFASDRTDYCHADALYDRKPIVRGAFGRNVRERARRAAGDAGYLKRWQPKRSGNQRFEFARQTLTLPATALRKRDNVMVLRKWFDATLSANELAAFIYLRAGTGQGPGVHAAEIAARFDWSRPTAAKVLKSLISLGLAVQTTTRKRGQVASVTYAAGKSNLWAITTVKKPGRGSPGHGIPGHIRTYGLSLNELPTGDSLPTNSPKGETVPHACGAALTDSELWLDAVSLIADESAEELLDSIDPHAVTELRDIAPDATLLKALRKACANRVARKLTTPVGALALRILAVAHATAIATASGESDPDAVPGNCLANLLTAIRQRIGDRPDQRLRSFTLLTKRIAGTNHGGGSKLYSPRNPVDPDTAAALRSADLTVALHPSLYRDADSLNALIAKYPDREFALEILLSRLRGLSAWGGRDDPEAIHWIGSWNYLSGTLADEHHAEHLTANGIRPGDVLGHHRRQTA